MYVYICTYIYTYTHMHSFFWHSSLRFLFLAAIPIFVALFGTLFGPADKPRHWQSLAQSPAIPNGILAIPKDTLPGCGFTREGAVS